MRTSLLLRPFESAAVAVLWAGAYGTACSAHEATGPGTSTGGAVTEMATSGGRGGAAVETPPADGALGESFVFSGFEWAAPNRVPDVANGEEQFYLTENVTREAGSLTFTAKNDKSQPNHSYTSGFAFWDSFSFLYGKLRVRAKFPGGAGTWPTIWLLDKSCQDQFHVDPDQGACIKVLEIDIAEPWHADYNRINQQIHDPFAGKHPKCDASVPDGNAEFHTYGFDWSPGKAVFLVDDRVTCSLTENVPSVPMFLILNVALGGIGGGTVDTKALPQKMQVSSITLEQ
jgi:beta-glucanase (GH16 family)